MYKRLLALIFALLMITFLFCGCKEKVELTCDNCGAKVTSYVDEEKSMDDSWIIYCEECNEELFGDDPLLGAD